jgi:hypothetical protein
MKRKFSILCGNPPYQAGTGNKGSNNTLWDRFVEKSLDLIENNGFLCLVHPSGWRNNENDITKKSLQFVAKRLKQNDLLYLEIHNEKDGQSVFNVSTRYDWYVACNRPNQGNTLIVDEDGLKHKFDLRNSKFIPNKIIKRVLSLVAKRGERTVEIIHNSAYHTHNYNHGNIMRISKEQTIFNCYPCVYSVNRQNVAKFRWSSFNDKGHFGIPKVIFGSGATGFLIDRDGRFGQTEFARSVVDEPKYLEVIAKALDSPKFKEIREAIAIGSSEINTDVLSLFRKDFWKEFI